MKIKAIVLSREDYEFNDDKTGEIISGSNIFYLIEDGLAPLKLSINDFNKNQNLLNEIVEVPAVYDLELKMSVSKGNMIQRVAGAKFIKPLELFKGL